MTFLSIHTMEGDPDDLLARKRRHMDPVVERLAPGFGAIASVTSKTASGVITVNLWATGDGAAAFSQNQEALHAQRESGLPMPGTFERFPGASRLACLCSASQRDKVHGSLLPLADCPM